VADDDSGSGGGAIICDARRDDEVEVGCDERGIGRGDGGTEFKSGAMTSYSSFGFFLILSAELRECRL
jgi:hypothetical protein